MIHFSVPLLGFAAYSGTGKTTLLEQVIPMLVEQGTRVALIKHSHHDIDLDKPGKDSFRLRKAGASQVVLAGTHRSICFHEYAQAHDSKLTEQLALLNTESVDLVLIEGYRHQSFPKIELHRKEIDKPFFFPTDPNIIALVSNVNVSHCQLPIFDFMELTALTTFIKEHIVASNKLRHLLK